MEHLFIQTGCFRQFKVRDVNISNLIRTVKTRVLSTWINVVNQWSSHKNVCPVLITFFCCISSVSVFIYPVVVLFDKCSVFTFTALSALYMNVCVWSSCCAVELGGPWAPPGVVQMKGSLQGRPCCCALCLSVLFPRKQRALNRLGLWPPPPAWLCLSRRRTLPALGDRPWARTSVPVSLHLSFLPCLAHGSPGWSCSKLKQVQVHVENGD